MFASKHCQNQGWVVRTLLHFSKTRWPGHQPTVVMDKVVQLKTPTFPLKPDLNVFDNSTCRLIPRTTGEQLDIFELRRHRVLFWEHAQITRYGGVDVVERVRANQLLPHLDLCPIPRFWRRCEVLCKTRLSPHCWCDEEAFGGADPYGRSSVSILGIYSYALSSHGHVEHLLQFILDFVGLEFKRELPLFSQNWQGDYEVVSPYLIFLSKWSRKSLLCGTWHWQNKCKIGGLEQVHLHMIPHGPVSILCTTLSELELGLGFQFNFSIFDFPI